MSEKTYYQKNRDVILNRAKDYYQNGKERFKKPAIDKYRSLTEKNKNKKREYGRNRYHNMSDEKIQRLNINKITVRTKNKNFDVFSLHCIKNGTRSCVFWTKWHH